MKQVWEAFDNWEKHQVCIRGHVRVVREEIERLVEQLHATELNFATVREDYNKLADRYQEAREIITRQHSLLWVVGLDIHEGEEPLSEEQSVENLRKLIKKQLGT